MRGVWVCQEYSPLRRRLFCGGCSWVEYQRIGAWRHGPVVSTDSSFFSFGKRVVVLERNRIWYRRVVFGTLLGPEATGPGVLWLWLRCFPGCLFLVSWRCGSAHVWPLFLGGCVWGVVYGVVV